MSNDQNTTPVELRYHGQSGLQDQDLRLFADANRSAATSPDGADSVDGETEAIGFRGRLRDPLKVREFLSLLYEVVKSDLRYVPKDRSAYLAFRQQNRTRSASGQAFQAQQEYYDWLYENDPTAWLLLDPIVTAHPDGLLMEVFSKDESTYLRVNFSWELFDLDSEPVYGTTNVDFGAPLFEALQELRDDRETFIGMSHEAFGVGTPEHGGAIEKRIPLPDSWLHGFLQVQSAATLADQIRFDLSPIDLYNLLRHLRLHADHKGKGRAIRAELIPGEKPRLILEPWELILPLDGAPYGGRDARVLRIWGRRRLLLLQRLTPFVDRVEVCLIDSGMPGFWIFHCGPVTVTLGMTGYVASNWSQTVHLDVMLPSAENADVESARWEKVAPHLKEAKLATLDELITATGTSREEVFSGLQWGCRHGEAIYDLATRQFRYRKLLFEAMDTEALLFRGPADRKAHDILEGRGASLEITGESEVPGRGVEYTAQIAVEADQREYETKFLLTDDGRVYRASCTCAQFRQHQLKEGPCPHLLALRIYLARQEKERHALRGTSALRSETRTYVRRDHRGEEVYTLRFDKKELRLHWGLRTDLERRKQRLLFNDIDEARAAFLSRAAELEARGFMNATESSS